MAEIEKYEIDDDFDPLEDIGFDDDLDEDGDPEEYQVPIPDADKSVVPEEIPLSAEERIDKLLMGMPGQKHRILYAIQLCSTTKTLEELSIELDEAFPTQVSVYDSTQIVKLLEKAGALSSSKIETLSDSGSDSIVDDSESGDYLTVGTPPVFEYIATEEGLDAIEKHFGEHRLVEVLTEEKQYLPLYRRILEMTSAEGGCPTTALDEAIDPDPLCVEPKRFCGYFLDKLEKVGAVKWQNAWIATDTGTKILDSELFATEERS